MLPYGLLRRNVAVKIQYDGKCGLKSLVRAKRKKSLTDTSRNDNSRAVAAKPIPTKSALCRKSLDAARALLILIRLIQKFHGTSSEHRSYKTAINQKGNPLPNNALH